MRMFLRLAFRKPHCFHGWRKLWSSPAAVPSPIRAQDVTSTVNFCQSVPGMGDTAGISGRVECPASQGVKLEAFGFQQHAGDIVVLGSIADEEIEFRHQALEHFGWFESFSRLNRS